MQPRRNARFGILQLRLEFRMVSRVNLQNLQTYFWIFCQRFPFSRTRISKRDDPPSGLQLALNLHLYFASPSSSKRLFPRTLPPPSFHKKTQLRQYIMIPSVDPQKMHLGQKNTFLKICERFLLQNKHNNCSITGLVFAHFPFPWCDEEA